MKTDFRTSGWRVNPSLVAREQGNSPDGLVDGLIDGIGDGLGDGVGDNLIDHVGCCLGIKSEGKIGDWIGSLSVRQRRIKSRIITRDKSGSKSGIISPYKLGGIADNLSISNDQFSIIDASRISGRTPHL